jgi:hypothetical protein
MQVTVYLLRKVGEPRIYTNTVGFEHGVRVKLEKEGFQLYRVVAELPDDIPLVASATYIGIGQVNREE